MKNGHWSLLLVLAFASCQFLGCGSVKPEPTAEELKQKEAEIVKGESAL